MEGQFVVALVLAIPIILFLAAFVWCLQINGIYAGIREALEQLRSTVLRLSPME